MDSRKTRYIIGEVLDNATQKRSIDFGGRVGKECYILLLELGESLVAEYTNGGVFWASSVKEVEQTDYGFWVKTKNLTYRFDTEGFYK